jgi:adenylyltransferase/sulfurtransferase
MFRLTAEAIKGPLLDVGHESGAVAVFEGRVRETNLGRKVTRLEYEAFSELAETEGERIVELAKVRFSIDRAACVHRTGSLGLGETAILVEVASGHRREAFEACAFIVDEIKRSVPIWKKEHYEDGASDWINCSDTSPPPGASISESAFYDRQTRLPELGETGQQALKNARVLVVGAGGLGCPALMYLAAAGVGTLGICEPDRLELGNLHRQVLFQTKDVGRSKAELAAEVLAGLNPFITIQTHLEAVDQENAEHLCTGYDLILDCTDSLESKFLLNDVAVAQQKSLVVGAVYQYEGQIFTVEPGGPCLRCLWPQAPPSGCVGNCAEVGVLGVIPGVLGSLQAAEALKLILGLERKAGALTLVDLLTLSMQNIEVKKNGDCPACGSGEISTGPWWEVHVHTASDLQGYYLVDIREADELRNEPLPIEVDAWRAMSSTSPEEILALDEGPILLVCRSGGRTGNMALAFEEAGIRRVYSLVGGRNGLVQNPNFQS